MSLPKEETDFKTDLLQGLKKMHTLRMVHRNIKDLNVAWSRHFSRWVFIDFGFATLLKEKIGEKSKSKFIGTYSYTTPELQRLYSSKHLGEVDFYYNDLFELKKAIRIMEVHEKEMKEENEKLNEQVEVEGFFLTVKKIKAQSYESELAYFIRRRSASSSARR